MPVQRLFITERNGDLFIIAPQADAGSLDDQEIQIEVADLLQQLRDCRPCNLLIDLELAPYFGSTMLGALIKLWRHVSQEQGRRVALCQVSDFVRDVLNVTKLDGVWPIFATREQALAGLRQTA